MSKVSLLSNAKVVLSHRIGGNRERSLIFRTIVNDCQIKRFRLPKHGNRRTQIRRFRLPLYRFWQSKTLILAIENEKLFKILRSRLPPIRCGYT